MRAFPTLLTRNAVEPARTYCERARRVIPKRALHVIDAEGIRRTIRELWLADGQQKGFQLIPAKTIRLGTGLQAVDRQVRFRFIVKEPRSFTRGIPVVNHHREKGGRK